MAGSKKKIKQKEHPHNRKPVRSEKPNSFYSQNPSWNFSMADPDCWSFTKDHIKDSIWTDIIPTMQKLETQTWDEIFIHTKKSNHSIAKSNLNKRAIKRIDELQLEADTIYSLRVNSTKRLYGLIDEGVFELLWYDDNHGDNSTCVCRSHKKHT